jgi:hypothetical protein
MTGPMEWRAGQVDTAIATYQRERARLFRTDGQPKYAPAELAEREQELLQPVLRAAETFQHDVDILVKGAEEALTLAEGGDPLDQLSGDDLQRANALAGFIREDAAELPVVDLVKRVRAAMVKGDRATLCLWYRYAGRRFDGLSDNVRTTEAAQELGSLIRELYTTLLPADLAKKRRDAEETLKEARKWRTHVSRRVSEIDGSLARIRAEARAMWAGAL